jgi:hypothetical protein
MNPARFSQMMKYLTRAKKEKPDLPDVFPASKAPIPAKTQNVEEMEAVNRFMRANPRKDMAGGGRIGFSNGPPGKSAFKKPYAPEIEKRIIELHQKDKLGAEAIAKKLRKEFDGVFGRSTVGKRITALKKEGKIKNIPVSERQASIDQRGEFFNKPAAKKYLAIRKVRDIDRKTRFKETFDTPSELKYNIPKNAKFKVDFKNPGVSGADVSDIPEKFRGVQYYSTRKAAEKAVAERKKLKLKADVDPDTARASANKKKYNLVKEVSDNNVERVLADFKKGQPLEQAHRLSLNQVKKTGEMYNVMNLGLDFDDPNFVEINNKFVKPYENKLKQLYKEQNQLYKKTKNLKSVPLELRKQIEFNNKKISVVVDLAGGRVQGLQLDEFTLKPKVTGVNYANVLGFGLYDKPVKQLTDIDRAEIALIMQGQIENEKKTAKKTAQKLFANKELLNNVDELAVTGLGRLKPPSGSGAVTIGALDVPSMFKRLSPGARKLVTGSGGFILPEVLFYQLDKRNRMSKGQSEKEAAAGALESGTLGAYDNKAYMEGLKETAESMGIDSNSFESAYQLNLLSKSYNQNNANYEKNYMQLLEMGDEQRADDLKKNFDRYTKETQNKYALLSNNISDNVMNTVGASPLIMKEGRENITQEKFEKPFLNMQDVAMEKLKREKQKAFDTQKRQVDTAAGSVGENFYQTFDSLTQGAKNLLKGRVLPFSSKIGLPQYEPLESDREREARYLKEMDPRELFLYNKERGFTYDNPITSGDIETLQYENPGVFFAGGGIAKLAGIDQGPPPVKGPNSQGLLSLKNRVRNY